MRWFLLGCVAAGCGKSDEVELTQTTGEGPTWERDVSPIMDQYCVRCHQPGGVGPADFTNYEEAARFASLMAMRVESGEMPPPAADPDCHPYESSERFVMTDEAKATLRAWADSGAAEGAPNTGTSEAWPAVKLSRVDTTIRTEGPYLPEFVDGNEYRCFILDADTSKAGFITGFDPIIDNTSISHHTQLFIDFEGSADAKVTDEATQSWHCPETLPDNDWLLLHAWAPGNNAVEFPEGAGTPVPAGSRLVLQMHYFRPGPEVDGLTDQPGYDLKLAANVDTEIYMAPVGPEGFTIPAGAAAHTETLSFEMQDFIGVPVKTTIYGVFPHMHLRGSSYDFWIDEPNGDETCVSRADGYDFENQPTYWFEEPVIAKPDSVLNVSCTWDNSGSTTDVTFGENTQNEMCYALMYVSFGF